MVKYRFLAQVKGKGVNPSALSGLGVRLFYFRLMKRDDSGV